MNITNTQFLIGGLVIAILIGCLAVFLASGDPDGLESTALYVQGEKTLTGDSPEDGDPEAVGVSDAVEYEAPLPDYSMGEDGGKGGEIFAVLAGIIIVFGLAFVATRIVAAKKS
ncbi:PDGLE domain-containing protein [Methanogenium organophilum]|uniref:PDGLE domain-containing protein n=1 Tax=Methanogenium organophilum TaxID=2199 RepID=A0A9X9T9V3_METOG|nr:PDGLE domain-containing protein [Methanogenium organophilum]WAI02457.1 PDGLE domain-containing protein [Methanogenium organophilum]